MKTRSYGIDLLKSISMLMIVILHILGVGGILSAAQEGSLAAAAAWLLEASCICAVNCFGLVSGYVLSRGRYRRSRLVSLWLRVVLESLVVTALFALFLRGTVGLADWLKALTPVLHGVYWYFTAYFALFFFVPYINKMLAALTKRETAGLAASVIFVFVILGNTPEMDLFNLHGGYGFLWLLCLYVLGGCLRTLISEMPPFSKYWFLAAYALCTLLSWTTMRLSGSQAPLSYTSPFTLLSAGCLLLFFKGLDIRTSFQHKAITMLARTSFGVYIIHTHPLIWTNLLSERFVSYLQLSVPFLLLAVLGTALAVYAFCTLGDWLIEKLLKLLRVDLLENVVDSFGSRRKRQNTAAK